MLPSTIGHPHAREDVGGADPLSGLGNDLRLVLVVGEHVDGDVRDAQLVLRCLHHALAVALSLSIDLSGDDDTVVTGLALAVLVGSRSDGLHIALVVDSGNVGDSTGRLVFVSEILPLQRGVAGPSQVG